MNRLSATIASVQQYESLYLLELDASGITLTLLLFDLNPRFAVGSKVQVLFKETEVIVAKELQGEISLNNRFQATVINIKKGNILADITLQCPAGTIASIITMSALDRMRLLQHDEVTVLIKATQLSLEAQIT
jgi:molybdate transport system regulatory protein